MGRFLDWAYKDKKLFMHKWWVWALLIFLVSLAPPPSELFLKKAKQPSAIIAIAPESPLDKKQVLAQLQGLKTDLANLQYEIIQLEKSLKEE